MHGGVVISQFGQFSVIPVYNYFFATFMSSADSMLLLCTTHLVYDIGMNLVPDVLTEKKVVKMLPWVKIGRAHV